jgi:hypothetical protein
MPRTARTSPQIFLDVHLLNDKVDSFYFIQFKMFYEQEFLVFMTLKCWINA